jgi:hypothetical protein
MTLSGKDSKLKKTDSHSSVSPRFTSTLNSTPETPPFIGALFLRVKQEKDLDPSYVTQSTQLLWSEETQTNHMSTTG